VAKPVQASFIDYIACRPREGQMSLRRRDFIVGLGGAATWPLAAFILSVLSLAISAMPVSTVSLNPADWYFQYSPGMPPTPFSSADGAWQFDFPAQDGVHYLTTALSKASGTVSMTAEIDASSSDVIFDYHTNPDNTCGGPNDQGTVSLYLERRGDKGTQPSFRFWSQPHTLWASTTSTYTIFMSASLSDPSAWTNVYGRHDAAGLRQTSKSLMAIGMTFGGGCFAGHGVFVRNGTATFILKDYAVR
jgi:hypothetical protein